MPATVYKTDCKTPVTTSAVTSAYYPLVDTASDCPSGTSDGTTCIDRETWAQGACHSLRKRHLPGSILDDHIMPFL